MNYAKIIKADTQNGEGIRLSLFVSGCENYCQGCFNKAAQDYNYGEPFTEQTFRDIISYLEKDYVSGLSLLGGDPLAPRNRGSVLKVCRAVKQLVPNKDIWLWTGYTLEFVKDVFPEILSEIDVMIDGRFEQSLHDPELLWRGSSNQRILKKGEDF